MLGRIFGVAVALCCAGCACMGAAGQAAAETGPSAASPPAATPTLGQELRRLGAAAESLEHTLPSLTCKETAASEIFAGKKSRERDEFTATLRAKRGEDGVLDETFEVTTLNGKAPRRSVRFPFYVSGGFDRSMRYFAPAQQVCYRYWLTPGRIDFSTAPDVALHAQCLDEGMHGFALLDADGDVVHLERTVTSKPAEERGIAPFASIDFGEVELGGKTFRLSRHMLSESWQGRFTLRFDATYTDCRLFTATVTIGPVMDWAPGDAGQGGTPGTPHP